jgi:hypothetical protein
MTPQPVSRVHNTHGGHMPILNLDEHVKLLDIENQLLAEENARLAAENDKLHSQKAQLLAVRDELQKEWREMASERAELLDALKQLRQRAVRELGDPECVFEIELADAVIAKAEGR